MLWFLQRISTRSLPIEFGIKERTAHPEDFEKLIKLKILKHNHNLDSVDCVLCDDENRHECQVRENNGELFYVCENGNGRKKLCDEDVAIFEYDNKNFLKLLTDELGISVDGASHKDEAVYSNDAFFRLGRYENKEKKMSVEVFYLRNGDAFEPSLCFGELGNTPKMLITNTMRADVVVGKENLFTCVLSGILAELKGKKIFNKKAFTENFDNIRRVRFDKKDGHLFLDNKRIYTAPLNGNHYLFLSYLWDKWMRQVPYSEIQKYIKNELGGQRTKDETAQKFCQKIKNEIKTKCKSIDKVITSPTIGHYMMADPL